MSEGERALFFEVAHREPPERPCRQLWVKAGRSSGKTETAAELVAFVAVRRDYRKLLSPGEFATCMLLAADRDQARIALDRVGGIFETSPALKQMVVKETASGLELSNQSRSEIHTSSFRSVRGRSLAICVMDEVAFWRDLQSANPDVEVYSAILPALAKVPDSLLVATSTPHARAGLMYDMHSKYFGTEDPDVLVVEGPTTLFNPTLDESLIAASRAADPSGAASEWDAEWREDLETFVSREVVLSLVVPGRIDLPPVIDDDIRYVAGTDPAGGSGKDAMTLAVAHNDPDTGRAVLDKVLCRRPPFSPEAVTKEFCECLRWYGVSEVRGDKFGGDWPAEQFSRYGVSYVPADRPKSDVYLTLLPHLNNRACELLDNEFLLAELVGLERMPQRGGPDKVDHARRASSHDDMINSAAIALLQAIAPAFNPKESDFMVADAPIASQLRELREQGYRGTDAMMMVDRPEAPWSTTSRRPSRVFAWGVASE